MIKLHQKLAAALFALVMVITPSVALASGSSLGVVRDGDSIYLSTSAATQSAVSSASPSGDVILFNGYASSLGSLISSVLTLVILISALLVFLQLITAAFQWLTSGGDKGKTDEARGKIVAAVIGLVIVAASWAVFLVVLRFLGFESYDDLFANMRLIS
ncbi:MAG: hypothetical protein O2840_04290 [bacterium]|nr:hypothetical protein [bacterium]